MPATNFAPSLSTFWKLIEGSGHDPRPLFRELGISPALISDPNARVSYAKVEAIWTWIGEQINDPCIGLKAQQYWHPSASGALGYAMLASSSLRTAIGRLQRYARVMTEAVQVLTEEAGGEFALALGFNQGKQGIPVQADGVLALLVSICRLNYGARFNPAAVHFSHSEPVCSGEFYAFFKCPVYFDMPDNRLLLPSAAMDERLPGANPQLAQLNDRIMIDYLARLDKNNVVARVKSAIIDQLPTGSVVDSGVAQSLHMNVRNLQRKLQQEGTSFKKILNQVREELALKYIKDSHLSLSEISFLLGFAETSSFSRAFKRWTGGSPTTYRARI